MRTTRMMRTARAMKAAKRAISPVKTTTNMEENKMAEKKGKKNELPCSKEALLDLAEEMNQVMFADDPVDFSEMTPEQVLAQVKQDMESIDPADKFSDEAKETLAEIGLEIEWIDTTTLSNAKKKAAKEKEEKEAAPSTANLEDFEAEDRDLEGMKAYAKKHGIRIPPPFLKDEDKLRNYIVDKIKNPGKKEKPAKKEKKESGSRGRGGAVNKHGHREGTMAAAIDEMIENGITKEDAVKKLMEDFGRDEAKSKAKFLSHVKHLEKEKGWGIKHNEKTDFYKLAA